MLTDFHVHIERGAYTYDWLDQFMETAQKNNIQEVGIVEHSHRLKEFSFLYDNVIQDESGLGIFQKDWIHNRRSNIPTEEYLDFLNEAKRKGYPIKIGLEICYFPHGEDRLKELLDNYDLDFVIGSIHWIAGWGFDLRREKSDWDGKEFSQIYEIYNRSLLQVIRSNLFDIIGHIDSIKAFSPWEDVNWISDEVLKELKNHDLCLEINTGLKHRRLYKQFCPTEEFLKRCFEKGIDITLSSDAHRPEDVGRLFDESTLLAKKVGYKEIVRFDRRQKEKIVIDK